MLALVVALGGTSYAALHLGKNSVGAKQLKKGAVRSAKVADGSLLARDFKAGQLPAGAPGPQGVPGPQGEAGAKGDQGPAGPAGPTQGAAKGFVDPPAGAKTLTATNKVTITTKTAGSVHITAGLSTWLSDCPGPGDCLVHYGLYLDGNPVPGAETEVGFPAKGGKTYQNLFVDGIAHDVPAGTHTAALRLIDLPDITGEVYGVDQGTLSAVLLGG